MATSGDMREKSDMVALCFEKNGFLDVAQLPADSLNQQMPSLRRCWSDSGFCCMPQELVALSGNVMAWPEISTLSHGMMPASDRKTCRNPSVASPTIGADANNCSSTDVWASEASTREWQSSQSAASTIEWESIGETSADSFGESYVDSPVSRPELGDFKFGMDMSPTNHRQNTHLGAPFDMNALQSGAVAMPGISEQHSGNVAMPGNALGDGFAPANNHVVPVGLLAHATGQCRPCAHFWRRAGCFKGDQCPRCHVCDEATFREYRQEHRRYQRASRRALKRMQTHV